MQFHYLAFSRTFVVDAAKVQYAVYDDAVQFVALGGTDLQCVGAHGIERYEYVTAYQAASCVVKRDDVGEIVVLQKLPIDQEYPWIVGKDVSHRSENTVMIPGHPTYPLFHEYVVFVGQFHSASGPRN